MQAITPFLWLDGRVEEAVNHWTSIFPDSRIVSLSRSGGPDGPGSVLSATLVLRGQEIMVLNGGPHYRLTPAFSLFVRCETQEEIDRCWEALLEGGEAQRCGWLTDRYGLTWQIVPSRLGSWLSDPDPARARRVTQAMLEMEKLDIAGLERAYAGEAGGT